MKITLERLAAVNYDEATDHENETFNLIRGCIDTIADYSYAPDDASKHQHLIQLEYTCRAILHKYKVNFEEDIFGRSMVLFEPEANLGNMGRILTCFGFMLGNIANMNSPEHDPAFAHDSMKRMAGEVYRLITGVLQITTCHKEIVLPNNTSTV